MDTNTRKPSWPRRLATSLAPIALVIGLSACDEALAMGDMHIRPPEAAEFGLGPRASAHRVYTATLEPRGPVRLRELQTVAVRIVGANGQPIDDASITIQGGMPQHRHGLPTQPRVTHSIGAGVYEIEGVRFSMGGWWEVKLAIDSPAGADSVTFNLSL